jgi:hypothetical protein
MKVYDYREKISFPTNNLIKMQIFLFFSTSFASKSIEFDEINLNKLEDCVELIDKS